MARDYTKIKAFQKADDLVLSVYEITQTWPKEELYGLVSQIRRAAVSVASNIVEGSGRRHPSEYLHFLSISRASLREVGYQLHLAHRLSYISDQAYTQIHELHEETSRVLWGLMEAVASQQNLPGAVSDGFVEYTYSETD